MIRLRRAGDLRFPFMRRSGMAESDAKGASQNKNPYKFTLTSHLNLSQLEFQNVTRIRYPAFTLASFYVSR